MGIDGIGGKPPIGPSGGPLGSAATSGGDFSLERGGGASDTRASEVSAGGALERLQAGELSLDEYVDTRVANAVAHLSNLLTPEQLEALRQQLKEQLQDDHTAAMLLQRATGVVSADTALDDQG